MYRAAPPGVLRAEPLGDLTALFDRRSMQTHLMVSPMSEILAALGDDGCTAATLAARLAATFELEEGADMRAVLADRLAELMAMGLVSSA